MKRVNMKLETVEENIKFIEDSYPKDTRVELIVSLLELEKVKDEQNIQNVHNIIDQIFSVVLKNLQWNIASSSNDWDYRPIEIMKKTFPNIENTQWYDIRHKQVISQLTGSK